MKTDFNIGLRTGLLEDKHFQKLGMAIWLYAWLIDKQPKDTDQVLYGKPITYEMVKDTFRSLTRSTYMRWLKTIRDSGYIETVKTPGGLVIIISKPKKWQRGVKNRTAAVSKIEQPIYIKNNNTINTHSVPVSKKQITTNSKGHVSVDGFETQLVDKEQKAIEKADKALAKRNPASSFTTSSSKQVIGMFEETFGGVYSPFDHRDVNILIKQNGLNTVIDYLDYALNEMPSGQFIVTINTPKDLCEKWTKLVKFRDDLQLQKNLGGLDWMDEEEQKLQEARERAKNGN